MSGGEMSVEQVIGIIAGLTALIGVIGKLAWNVAKKEEAPGIRLMSYEELDRELDDTKGLLRQQHQEMRINDQGMRDRLVAIETKIDSILRRLN